MLLADDAMAILSALNWEQLEVVGITTLFGNVPTAMATENALILRDMASKHSDAARAIPVVEGSPTSFTGQEKHRIADFVHGKDGFGNHRPALSTVRPSPLTSIHVPVSLPFPFEQYYLRTYRHSCKNADKVQILVRISLQGPAQQPVGQLSLTATIYAQASAQPGSAVDFIIESVRAHPGEIVLLALAATTNIALALQKDPDLADLWARVVVLGGAFNVGGNVNPAAEANVFGDPEAADYLFQHGKRVQVVGLDVTHECVLSTAQLASLDGALSSGGQSVRSQVADLCRLNLTGDRISNS